MRVQPGHLASSLASTLSVGILEEDDGAGAARFAGYESLDNRAEDSAPLAQNHGFFRRPDPDDGTEAVIAKIGAQAEHPIAIATLDPRIGDVIEKSGLDAGETIVYNKAAAVILRNDGTVEIRTLEGTAASLATLQDITELRDWIHEEMIIVTPGGNSTPGTTAPPPVPAGTTVLKGE